MKILVTGGAGYIGSHTVKALQKAGHSPIVLDNLDRGHRQAVPEDIPFFQKNIMDEDMASFMKEQGIEGIMHFAAHSQVGESMEKPNIYYENNVVGSFKLIEAARLAGVKNFVFSSTAATYGEPERVPITEDAPLHPTNVYGRTKLMIEQTLRDYCMVYDMNYVALRYFNAAGADPEGLIGEDHHPETHLIPIILQAAQGKRESISIFGTDYPTPDGTCIRDYIHVNDLASAHILAMEYLAKGGQSKAFNLGTGNGFSVKEIVDAAKKVTGVDFKVVIGPRRVGDPGRLVASSDLIKKTLGWEPIYSDVENIIKDAWNWHVNHPNGYGDR